MSTLPTWIAPGKAADMVFDVRASGVDALGYALLRPRRKAVNTAAGMAFAKLNPVEPTADSSRTRCGWPTTARDHRLVLAPGTADPISLAQLFGDYDAATVKHQRLLAAVLTVPFDRDRPLHDSFDQLADEQPHGHLLMLARVHTAAGRWGALHPYLTEEAHGRWADDWTRFAEGWRRLEAA